MAHTIISNQTAAVASQVPFKVTPTRIPATLIATGIQSGDSVQIFASADDGSTWEAIKIDGADLVLDDQNNTFGIDHPMIIGVTKPITTGAVGVYLSSADNL